MKACFCIGHRDAAERYYVPLSETVERLIVERGVDDFIVGHYGDFDRMVVRAVLSAKARHPEVRLTLLLPYLTEDALPEGFDDSFYPDGMEGVPKRFAIVRANRAMVKYCDCLIACVHRTVGNAHKIMEYAIRQGLTVINICDESSNTP